MGTPADTSPMQVLEECDRALVQRMAAGDRAALAGFYDRWVACVYDLALLMLHNAHDAEDVVEDVFWQAWRTADRYASARASVRTWLLMIARSRALDHLRARRARRDRPLSDLPADVALDLPSAAHSPLERTEEAERQARLWAALGELPLEQRDVLELAYFQGCSQSEIASRTGAPLGTIKTRVRLAIRKLRTTLSILDEERL